MPKSPSISCSALTLLGAATVLAVGCVGPQRAIEKAVYCHEAKQAYQACGGGCSLDCESARHFERGWRRGYVATALGRAGCAPALPPHPYLGKRYQSPDGQQLTSLWFAGYEEGVAAARRCGRGPQVVTHEVGCQDGCQEGCTVPAPGVLPDADYVVAIQSASYQVPVVPTAQPADTPVEASVPETIPAAEVGAPSSAPASEPAEVPSLRMPEPLSDSKPTSPRSSRSYRRMIVPMQMVAPPESSSVKLAFPTGAGDLPAVRVMPTGFAEAPASSDRPVKANIENGVAGSIPAYEASETTTLSFPAEPVDLPAVATRPTKPANTTANESQTNE